jgi:hypothetical protein
LLSSAERRLRAQIAAHSLHAQRDSRELTRPAREAFLARFIAEVDPTGELPEAERLRRARHALAAHMRRLALASAKARRRKGAGT